jgi:DHA1 family bicyclomycin/chloramphenicol resistance-like MFS transporter
MALLIVFGAVLGAALWARLPETRPVSATETLSPLAAAGRILAHQEFLLAALSSSLIYSALFTWLTTSPFLMIDGLGYSTGAAAMVLGMASAGYMAGSLGAARLSVRHASGRLVLIGAGLMLAGALSTLAVVTLIHPAPLLLLTGVLPFYIGLGIAHANALQLVMRPFGDMAGQASAWLGLVQQLAGVAISTAAVAFGGGVVAILAMIGCCAVLMVVSVAIVRNVPG